MSIKSLFIDAIRLLKPSLNGTRSQLIPKVAGSLVLNVSLDDEESSFCSSLLSFCDDNLLLSLSNSLTT
jgi:hypothetical protein